MAMEKDLHAKFHKKLKKLCPDAFYYKIPDTGGTGGRKPFDAFILMWGYAYAIEFKVGKNKCTPYQTFQMAEFLKAGGSIFVIKDDMDLEEWIKGTAAYQLKKEAEE